MDEGPSRQRPRPRCRACRSRERGSGSRSFSAGTETRRKHTVGLARSRRDGKSDADVFRSPPYPGYRPSPALAATHLHFLFVAGPGLIVMVADNDAGAVSTYTQAGAQDGTSLLWVLLLLLPVTYFVQEMVARLGIATGQGHAAMIYRRFGKWWGRFSLADLLIVNFLTLVTEFAAITLAARHLGVSPVIAVPAAAIGLVLLVGTGSYRRWERMTLGLCGLNLAWLFLAWYVGPEARAIIRDSFVPSAPPGGITGDPRFWSSPSSGRRSRRGSSSSSRAALPTSGFVSLIYAGRASTRWRAPSRSSYSPAA